jgi:hypothetical protein
VKSRGNSLLINRIRAILETAADEIEQLYCKNK